MAETLYIRIGSQAQDAIHWLIKTNANDEIIASGELRNSTELKQLTEKAEHRSVITLVPSCDLVLKSLSVPSKSTRAMRLAVPYMLEDELAQDVDQLFFAYADIDKQFDEAVKDKNCFVAALDRTLMQQWLQWFIDADISCKKMLPDVLALPLVKNGCSAIVLEEQILIRQGVWQGITIDFSAWPVISRQLINSVISSEKEDQNQQERFSIHAYSALPSDSKELNITAMPEELPLALLAQHAQQQPFNLMQGEFQYKEKRSPVRANWLWAAGIAVFALLFNIGIKGSHLMQLNAQQDLINKEIIQNYKRVFPNSKKVRINTIKSQLKRKISAAGGEGEQAGFLAMLSKVLPAFSAVPELKPESLKFDGKRQEIRIQAVASDYQYFDTFKSEIEKTDLGVEQGAQSSQGEQVSGSFSISDRSNGKRNARGGKS
ncbi:MAG: type II secretion system protein GspL [Colwellia sp.]|nr:type II secretion system protein GspL [Colwellia sp.]